MLKVLGYCAEGGGGCALYAGGSEWCAMCAMGAGVMVCMLFCMHMLFCMLFGMFFRMRFRMRFRMLFRMLLCMLLCVLEAMEGEFCLPYASRKLCSMCWRTRRTCGM